MTLSQALNKAKKELSQKGFRGGLESEILLGFVLQKERVFLHTHAYLELNHEEEARFFELVEKRLNDCPIEYLLESCDFYGRSFFVNEHVLIPRPETEILVQKALDVISQYHLKEIGEIGVGSACVSVSLALENPKLSIHASDVSLKALEVASKNIERFNLKERVFLKKRIFGIACQRYKCLSLIRPISLVVILWKNPFSKNRTKPFLEELKAMKS